MKIKITSLLFCLFSIVSMSTWAQGEDIFDDSFVHEIRVTFDDDNFWATLSSDYNNNYPNVPYQMASVSIDGEALDSIGIRQKGFASHFSVDGNKKSMKIDFNKFIEDQKYDGLKKINMNNGAGDPAMQRDKLCYDIMNKAGVNAPRTSYAKIFLNDSYWGLYLLVEQIDRTFIKDNFSNNDGNLFKNIGNSFLDWQGNSAAAYQQIFELKTDPNPEAWDDFVSLMDVINNSSDADFEEQINDVFNVGLYLKVLAVDVVTSNWDSYLEHGRNFYMYQDSLTKQFNWIPWDYNFALGGTFPDFGGGGGGGGGNPIDDPENCATILNGSCPYPATDTIFQQVINEDNFCCNSEWDDICQNLYDDFADGNPPGGGGSGPGPVPNINLFPVDMSNSEKVLIKRLMNVQAFQDRYYQEFCTLLDNNFTTERIFPMIEQFGNLIRQDIETDPNYLWTLDQFEADLDTNTMSNIPGLKTFFESQSITMRNELNAAFDCQATGSTLSALDISINEFMASNDSLTGLADANGEYDDWIELYNNTASEIDLSNAFLTNNEDKPKKWNFPLGTKISANGFLIVWADEDEGQEGLHCNFKLKKVGSFIMLSEQDLILDSLSYGEQTSNKTFSRVPNGTGDYTIQGHTFEENNENTSSIASISNNKIKVYPNPAQQFINISFESVPKQISNASLYNNIGQQVLTRDLNGKINQLQFDDLQSGMYHLVIRDKDGQTMHTEKVVVQR